MRQGDNLSPTLFAYLINSLALAIMNLGIGVALGNDRVSILLYADDMVLIGKNERELQTMLNCMYDWSKQWRLKVNTDKTKIIHFRPTRQNVTRYNFNYGDSAVECVKYYKYLGVCVDEFLKYDKC